LKIKGTALEKAKNGAVLVPEFVAAWATGTACWGLGRRFLDQRIGLMSFGWTTSARFDWPEPSVGFRCLHWLPGSGAHGAHQQKIYGFE
jgi:hypothetical protein